MATSDVIRQAALYAMEHMQFADAAYFAEKRYMASGKKDGVALSILIAAYSQFDLTRAEQYPFFLLTGAV